ncbi:hypothetical protein ACN47E_007760 [Coniothyrium glycines]
MDSPLGITRPWTPPETDVESLRSDYFSGPYKSPFQRTSDRPGPWSAHRHDAAAAGARCDTPLQDQQLRPKPVSAVTVPAPYTPTKNPNARNLYANGALRYPYTPDSSRILQRSITELPSSPVPWDVPLEHSPEHSPSPVQHALSSCISHFENLIQSHHPDEDQMEYIIGQFESMASYLSAPEAQTKTTDEHLFSDPEAGLGIGRGEHSNGLAQKAALINQEYMAEVDNYIEGVRKYIGDLKMRLDEVKALNSIQCDVIHDLRRQMKAVRQGMQSSLSRGNEYKKAEEEIENTNDAKPTKDTGAETDSEDTEFGVESWETLVNADDRPSTSSQNIEAAYSKELQRIIDSQLLERPAAKPKTRIITIIRKPEKRSFWGSIGEALDQFGALLHDE